MKKRISLLMAVLVLAVAMFVAPTGALAAGTDLISSTSQLDKKTNQFVDVGELTLYPDMGKSYIYFNFPSSSTESAELSLKQKGGSRSYDISAGVYAYGTSGFFSGDLSHVAAGEYYIEGTYEYVYRYLTVYINGRPMTSRPLYDTADIKSQKTITIKKGSFASSSAGKSGTGNSGAAGSTGTAKKNGWVQDGSKWYYGESGKYVTGWKPIGNKWYYFNAKGVMQTSWQEVDGKWFYMDANGVMQTGWSKQGSTWYFLYSNGVMATSWVQSNGTWYYMYPSGAMATGWVKDGNTWYYMRSSGAMATGWVQYGGSWYYMKSSGAMAANEWVKDGGTWYYMKGSGAMATGTLSIGAKTYKFAASGAWIG